MLFGGVRIFEIDSSQYVELWNDLIKDVTVILLIEGLQRYVLKQQLVDAVFIYMMGFIALGHVLYHLITNKIIGAGGMDTMCCPIPFLGGGWDDVIIQEEEPQKKEKGEPSYPDVPIEKPPMRQLDMQFQQVIPMSSASNPQHADYFGF